MCGEMSVFTARYLRTHRHVGGDCYVMLMLYPVMPMSYVRTVMLEGAPVDCSCRRAAREMLST